MYLDQHLTELHMYSSKIRAVCSSIRNNANGVIVLCVKKKKKKGKMHPNFHAAHVKTLNKTALC